MKILVIGSGGREHAIVCALSKSDKVSEIHVAPGNGGCVGLATLVPISSTDISGLVNYAKKEKFDLTVVGMDAPLVMGIVDEFNREGLRIFGPTKAAAEIEGSKAFAKNLMKKYGIKTAAYEVFEDFEEALFYCKKSKFPIVIKADGLALGKGVVICNNLAEAEAALNSSMKEQKFGESGSKVVIEEFLVGREVSVLAFCDGNTIVPMPVAKDYKRALEKDLGLNTGGMGNISPVAYYTDNVADECMDIFTKTVQAMRQEGTPFVGILFFGLIITDDGPAVIEYNCRFGDPETQVLLPKLKTDLLDIFNACIDGNLSELNIEWSDDASICVVLASGGYPESYETGFLIEGLETCDDVIIYHAGTKCIDGKFYTAGGRVLNIVAVGEFNGAKETVYRNIKKIKFNNMQYRKDIGLVD